MYKEEFKMTHEDHHKFLMEVLDEVSGRIDNLEIKINTLFDERRNE